MTMKWNWPVILALRGVTLRSAHVVCIVVYAPIIQASLYMRRYTIYAVGPLLLNGSETFRSCSNLTKCLRVMRFSLNCKIDNSLYGDARLKSTRLQPSGYYQKNIFLIVFWLFHSVRYTIIAIDVLAIIAIHLSSNDFLNSCAWQCTAQHYKE
jgi:hypothetical protein